jgi:hypothetical protein
VLLLEESVHCFFAIINGTHDVVLQKVREGWKMAGQWKQVEPQLAKEAQQGMQTNRNTHTATGCLKYVFLKDQPCECTTSLPAPNLSTIFYAPYKRSVYLRSTLVKSIPYFSANLSRLLSS